MEDVDLVVFVALGQLLAVLGGLLTNVHAVGVDGADDGVVRLILRGVENAAGQVHIGAGGAGGGGQVGGRLALGELALVDPALNAGGKVDAEVPIPLLLIDAKAAERGGPGAHIRAGGGLAHELHVLGVHIAGGRDAPIPRALQLLHDGGGGKVSLGRDHGPVAAGQDGVGIVELEDVRIAVAQIRHAGRPLLGQAHPGALALAPAEEPAAAAHLGGEADAVVAQDDLVLGQLVEGHLHRFRGGGSPPAHLERGGEAILGRVARGRVALAAVAFQGVDGQNGVAAGLGQQVFIELLGQGLRGVPRDGDHQVHHLGAGDVKGIELALVGAGIGLAAAPLGLGCQDDTAVAGAVVGLDGLAVVEQGLPRHLRGAGVDPIRRGEIAVVDLIGGGIVHVIGLAAADAHLRQGIALGRHHGRLEQGFGGVLAHLGHGHPGDIGLHAHGVHRPHGAGGHIEGHVALVLTLLGPGRGQGEAGVLPGFRGGGQGEAFPGEQLSLLIVGRHHVHAGHGHRQCTAGEGDAVGGIGAGKGQGQNIPSLRAQQDPHGVILGEGADRERYEPRNHDEGYEETQLLFHTSVYTIRARKRK